MFHSPQHQQETACLPQRSFWKCGVTLKRNEIPSKTVLVITNMSAWGRSHVLALTFSCKCSSVGCNEYWSTGKHDVATANPPLIWSHRKAPHALNAIYCGFKWQQDRSESIQKFMLFLIGLCAVVTAKGFYTWTGNSAAPHLLFWKKHLCSQGPRSTTCN